LLQIAKDFGVAERTVYLWLKKVEEGRAIEKKRPKSHRSRLTLEQENAIVSALLSNTPETSVEQIRRTLLRALPSLMEYETSDGKTVKISARTIGKIKKRLLSDPTTATMFATDDDKKEHLRVAVGKVFANYANDLWEMDMTRCDVMVIDTNTGKIARPRIHAIIDVYSRTIPGLAFSFAEDQTQTDLALLRALVPKPAPYGKLWRVWGTPKTLYWDNGKTYTSHHAERVCRELGIRSVHSTPLKSHSRGAIERFFGTMHTYEKTIPGYVGENAVQRSSEGMKRLVKNTENWRDRDYARDPGWGHRLPTLAEYQHHILNWLLVEYHQGEYEGQPRLTRFLETAPTHTLAIPDKHELMLIIGHRETRKVNALGQIRLNNRMWGIPSGELINYSGHEVYVIADQFALGDDKRLIAWRAPYTGEVRVLGEAQPVPEIAASSEADEWRRNAKAQAQAAQQAAATLKREYTDPTLIAANAMQREAQALMDVQTPELPKPERKFAALESDVDDDARRFAAIRPEQDETYKKLLAKMRPKEGENNG